jgi:hypothetical protein
MIVPVGYTVPIAIGPFVDSGGAPVASAAVTVAAYLNGVLHSLTGTAGNTDANGISKFTPVAGDFAPAGQLLMVGTVSGALVWFGEFQVGTLASTPVTNGASAGGGVACFTLSNTSNATLLYMRCINTTFYIDNFGNYVSNANGVNWVLWSLGSVTGFPAGSYTGPVVASNPASTSGASYTGSHTFTATVSAPFVNAISVNGTGQTAADLGAMAVNFAMTGSVAGSDWVFSTNTLQNASGTGATAAEVWSYATRTLTQYGSGTVVVANPVSQNRNIEIQQGDAYDAITNDAITFYDDGTWPAMTDGGGVQLATVAVKIGLALETNPTAVAFSFDCVVSGVSPSQVIIPTITAAETAAIPGAIYLHNIRASLDVPTNSEIRLLISGTANVKVPLAITW